MIPLRQSMNNHLVGHHDTTATTPEQPPSGYHDTTATIHEQPPSGYHDTTATIHEQPPSGMVQQSKEVRQPGTH